MDKALYYSLRDICSLSYSEKAYIVNYFFDLNNHSSILNLPAYEELLNKRRGKSLEEAVLNYTTQDITDLIFLYNLAFLPSDILESDSYFNILLKQGKNYTSSDIRKVIDYQFNILKEVLPLHSKLSQEGVLELTSSPNTHPILPLLINSTIANIPEPNLPLPSNPFRYPEDALVQLKKGRVIFEEYLGITPKGLWPSEGAICQNTLDLVREAGYEWVATDEGILEKSLYLKIRLDDKMPDPELLYRVYEFKGVKIFFRDRALSDKIGFIYRNMTPDEAVNDFVNYLKEICLSLKEAGRYHILVALDGENPWDHYSGDGSLFITALFSALTNLPWIKVTTPSAFLEQRESVKKLEVLHPGSWIGANFSTWIGEEEENCAFELLRRTREFLFEFEKMHPNDPRLKSAYDHLYSAEGSDWFWWFGKDWDSGRDDLFDFIFRRHLMGVYLTLNITPPTYLEEPIVLPTIIL